MTKRLSLVTTLAFFFMSVLGIAACGSKTPPRSTTTTSTQSTSTTDTGANTSSETTETVTQQPDGSQSVKRTETTNQDVPAPAGPKQ